MDGLTTIQVQQFFEEGYVMVPDIFAPGDLEALQAEIDGLVEAAAERLYAAGQISDRRETEGFTTRLSRLLADHPELKWEYLHAIEGKGGGRHTGRAIFDILMHSRLLDAMESLVGPEIVGSSVYRIRPKVPGLDRGVVPWHQDSGYFAAHCDDSLIVTCWIPLVDATPENGCLRVLPRTHRQGVSRHHTGGNANFLVIEEDDLPAPSTEAVTVPVPLGGALLMTNLTPHCSTENTTDVIRWSVDLRYQGREVPNNLTAPETELDPNAPEVRIACYPPEGDFVVRSPRFPEQVYTYEQFVARRALFEAAKIGGPGRGWQPVGTEKV
jgi:phytanoyl-CoA hydroxylase